MHAAPLRGMSIKRRAKAARNAAKGAAPRKTSARRRVPCSFSVTAANAWRRLPRCGLARIAKTSKTRAIGACQRKTQRARLRGGVKIIGV